MSIDLEGNLRTTEVSDDFAAGEGCKRIQRLVFKVYVIEADELGGAVRNMTGGLVFMAYHLFKYLWIDSYRE
jgi:hypothetical protein